MIALRPVVAAKYLVPLREGGSLPAVVEADDGGLYVVKFVGAGHGRRALVAEVIAGELARALGLDVPELVLVELDPAMGRSEPDEEIQDLLWASAGLNLGVRFLPGALAFHPALSPPPDDAMAARIVWFDAFVTNMDRSAQNTNLLVWDERLWLIDHGSALYFHHNWTGYQERTANPFPQIQDHVLLPLAGDLRTADTASRALLANGVMDAVVGAVPDAWLGDVPAFADRAAHRAAYVAYLDRRLASATVFVEEAERARARVV